MDLPPGWGKVVHALAGFLIAFSVLIHWILPPMGGVIFFAYEWTQYRRYGDWPDEETRECGFGFFLGCTILIILYFAGVI